MTQTKKRFPTTINGITDLERKEEVEVSTLTLGDTDGEDILIQINNASDDYDDLILQEGHNDYNRGWFNPDQQCHRRGSGVLE